jgi:hypothetical protein
MEIQVSLITDASQLSQSKEELEPYLAGQSNPFLTYQFLSNALKVYNTNRETPVIIIYRFKREIIGVAALLLIKRFFFRIATSLPRHSFSPDFIFLNEYRSTLLELTINILFHKLNSKLLLLYLPAESQTNLCVQNLCVRTNLFLQQDAEHFLNHKITTIDKSWDELEGNRTSNLRRQFRVFERNLDNSGLWKITFTPLEPDNSAEIFNKIFEIENMSWKKIRQEQTGVFDRDLPWILESSLSTLKQTGQFNASVGFLELNNTNVAYSLYLQFRETAYIAKTSFAEKYRRLYLGIFLNNEVIKNLFQKGEVKRVDWLTSLEFMRNWPSSSHIRFRYLISQGTMTYLIKFMKLFKCLLKEEINWLERID